MNIFQLFQQQKKLRQKIKNFGPKKIFTENKIVEKNFAKKNLLKYFIVKTNFHPKKICKKNLAEKKFSQIFFSKTFFFGPTSYPRLKYKKNFAPKKS